MSTKSANVLHFLVVPGLQKTKVQNVCRFGWKKQNQQKRLYFCLFVGFGKNQICKTFADFVEKKNKISKSVALQFFPNPQQILTTQKEASSILVRTVMPTMPVMVLVTKPAFRSNPPHVRGTAYNNFENNTHNNKNITTTSIIY